MMENTNMHKNNVPTDDTVKTISVAEHREWMTHERWTINRLSIVVVAVAIVAMISLVAMGFIMYNNNQKWINYLSEYDFESYQVEYTQDGQGVNIIGNGNGVDYDVPKGNSSETDENS